jgi:F0F1-type ATP synthase delta subunit
VDAKQFLSQLRRELESAPENDALKQILSKIEDPAVIPEILDYVATSNDRADLKKELIAFKRLADDRNATRNTQKVIYLSATGTGIAAMVGSIGIVASLATGFFLIPLFVGGVVATHGGVAAFKATEEERTYNQIHEQLKTIEVAIADKFK